jgi:hypothetical protein
MTKRTERRAENEIDGERKVRAAHRAKHYKKVMFRLTPGFDRVSLRADQGIAPRHPAMCLRRS